MEIKAAGPAQGAGATEAAQCGGEAERPAWSKAGFPRWRFLRDAEVIRSKNDSGSTSDRDGDPD